MKDLKYSATFFIPALAAMGLLIGGYSIIMATGFRIRPSAPFRVITA